MKNSKHLFLSLVLLSAWTLGFAKPADLLKDYELTWTTQSKGSNESMPCGGGDIGMNVWVEQGELLVYFSRSGSFDENSCFLKGGRLRLSFPDEPLDTVEFLQCLKLSRGLVNIQAGSKGNKVDIDVWADVFKPVIHLDIRSASPRKAVISYENWRYRDRLLRKNESQSNSYKWAPPADLKTSADKIDINENGIVFYHQNPSSGTMFDVVVQQQGMEEVKEQMTDPLSDLRFGGELCADGFVFKDTITGVYAGTDFKAWRLESRKPSKNHAIRLVFHTTQQVDSWHKGLDSIKGLIKPRSDKQLNADWWATFWDRSFICIDPEQPDTESWKVGRNYQLFRYMLACNLRGEAPTKFNGGLFTFDPVHVREDRPFTPDFRNWGGGTFTAQNQRLVYFGMLKSGDFDLMIPQFEFYRKSLKNAELRSNHYWGHNGACYTEQMEHFGLPNPSEYGWKRPENYDPGLEYNAWLEYQWETVLEFCLMILESHRYAGSDISPYMEFIESTLTFFDEHYRFLARQRGSKELNADGQLILYPTSACETYKMAYNSTSCIAGLKVVLESLLALENLSSDQRERWEKMLQTIPPISFREIEGKKVIAPALHWERINNTEVPQLYPVFPWRIYNVVSEDKDTGINTYWLDPDVREFYSHVGWKQYNIFAACLGLTEEAKKLTLLKFKDAEHRFPCFWGPGFDWTPDHNWGGSASIGLQEMLLQTEGERILLFPAWPAGWDVHFKLHAPGQTTVEAELKDGKLLRLEVSPKERLADVENRLVIQE